MLRRARVGAGYLWSHLGRRRKELWVFGNQKGFRDNPRYLAQHVDATHPEIEAWWIAHTPAEADAARRAGLAAAVRGSREARRRQRAAGAAFLSNGFGDLEPEHLGGAFVVDLRHGKGLKRVLLDADGGGDRARWRGRLAERARRWLAARRLARIDLIVAPGEMARSMYLTAYGTRPDRIRVLGTPRFDVLHGGDAYRRAAGGDPREALGLAPDDHVVLWLPTWREAGDAAWLPPLDATAFAEAVDGTSVVLVIKPHPFSDEAVFRERLPDHPRLRLLPEAGVDANCLLRVADALITDFSSAAFDYALLDRPIHFFVPDLADYRGGRGLYEPIETISGGVQHETWGTLLPAIRRSACGEDPDDRASARLVRQRAGHRDEPGSSERIVRAVASEIGLALGTPTGAG